jgi:magnesium transporter
MFRLRHKGSKKAGLPPGTLVYVGEKKAEAVKISLIDYDEATLNERELASIDECIPYKGEPTITWLNIDGLHEVGVVEQTGKIFGLHPLVLEDIVHTGQRPKLEDYDDYLFVVTKMPRYDNNEIILEQFSMVIGPNFLLTFQEKTGDVFGPIRERLGKSKGQIRSRGSDYLAYALLDAIVDSYFAILERLGDRIETLDELLIEQPGPRAVQEIHELKRDLILYRKSAWPQRDVLASLMRDESKLVQERTRVFLRDVYDHTVQVIDTLETFRDMVSGMLDVYLSNVSNRMNEVMKILTIMATIFMPLTLIAGIYGMNFKYIPELEWHLGYPIVLGVMVVIGVGMLASFKKRRWI